MGNLRRWTLAALLALGLIGAGLAPTAAVAAPTVSDLPTLSISVDAGAFSAVNADINHDTTAGIDVEVTDPANPSNNLTVGGRTTEIKGRGNYTWTMPSSKKPYQIKFADGNSQNLLGMGAARAWVLLANTADASLMRNKVAFDLAEEFGLAYTTESRWVDLVVNGRPWGNYLLTEKVEVKKTRVDLKNKQGVLVEQDYNYGTGDPIYFRTPRSKSYFVLKDAKGGNPDTAAQLATPEFANTQAGWNEFVSKIDSLDRLLADPNGNWGAINNLIDVDSFVKFFFLYEFTENQELARSSVHFYRDGTTDKIHAGPAWDFDAALGNFDDNLTGRGGNPEVDYVANVVAWRPDGLGNDWFPQLLKSTEFNARAKAMYPSLRNGIDNVPWKIYQYREYITRSASANFSRWPGILGGKTLLPYGSRRYASAFDGEVGRLLTWVHKRIAYMDQKYAGTTADATACAAATPSGTNSAPGSFNALNPCRLLDTRSGNGAPTGAVASNGELTLKVTGRGGVPATASAVVLNVTVAQPQAPGHLTVYPAGTALPVASNLNFVARQDVPNQVIVTVGEGGQVNLRNTSAGATNIVADLAGYFAGGGTAAAAGAFQGNTPIRILDTREASDVTQGARVAHAKEVSLQVTGAHQRPVGDAVTIPTDASAVVMNVTAASPTASGYVTVYPAGGQLPDVSNLNFVASPNAVPNLVTVKIGDAGKVNLRVTTDPDPVNGQVHLIADVAGYYVGGTPTTPGTFVALSPKRILDSRTGTGMVPKLAIDSLARRLNNYETIALDVAGTLGGPSPAEVGAAVMNVTVVNPTGSGYVTIHPDGVTRPSASSVNFAAGQTVPNSVTVRTGTNGKVDFYTFTAGQTNLIADLAGYYRK